MIKRTAYDVTTDTHWLRYSAFRLTPDGVQQFDITLDADTARPLIAFKLWHDLRPAMRGTQPLTVERSGMLVRQALGWSA